MALDSTYKGANANSYCSTVAEIRSLAASLAAIPFLGLSDAGVVAMSDAAVEMAAVMAADGIDTAAFLGVKATQTQAREWPRVYLAQARYNDNGSTYPDAIKQAQVAQIMSLATAQTAQQSAQAAGVASFSIGEQSVSFGGASSTSSGTRPLGTAAEMILQNAGVVQGRIGSVYVPRG